jgi:hypothetical protein
MLEEPAEGPDGDPGTPASGPPPPRRRRRRALIIGLTAAVAALAAAAAAITAGSPHQGPQYAAPRKTCNLLTAATVAKYAPDAAGDGAQYFCNWITGSVILAVTVRIYSSSSGGAGAAQQYFTGYIHALGKGGTAEGTVITITAERPVTGLGDQATALFETLTTADDAGPGVTDRQVDLFVRSGNAVIDVTYFVMPDTVELDDSITMARDVLAALPRS